MRVKEPCEGWLKIISRNWRGAHCESELSLEIDKEGKLKINFKFCTLRDVLYFLVMQYNEKQNYYLAISHFSQNV